MTLFSFPLIRFETPLSIELFGCCLKIFVLTLDDDDAVGGVWAEAVGGDALVLAAVAGLAVDDLDGDDAVRVRDRVLVRLKLLPALEPFDLQGNSKIRWRPGTIMWQLRL